MPGLSLRHALGIILLPCLVAAEFPPADDFFRQGRPHFDIYSARTKPSPWDESQPLEARARAYLDGHCSACHQPGGVLQGSLDLRFATPLARTGLFAWSGRRGPEGFLARVRPGRPGESDLYRRLGSMGSDAMPPLGRTLLDERGLALIRAWIEGMSAVPPSPPSPLGPLRAAPARHPSAGTVFHDPLRAQAPLFIPHVGEEPVAPPAVRICDAGGNCRHFDPAAVQVDGSRDGWALQGPAPLPRGRYPLVLAWPGRIVRRILLVL